jgi:hypothetical protein
MFAKALLGLALAALTACGVGDLGDLARAAEPVTYAGTIFGLMAQQAYQIPPDVPDDLLQVPDLYNPAAPLSLRAGAVIGAWTTTPTAAGLPAALIYRCQPDDDGDYVWNVAPDTGLAPLGIDPAELATVLPFSAEHTEADNKGIYLISPSGPAWTVSGPIGEGSTATTLRAELIAPVDVEEELAPRGSVPPCRYKRAQATVSPFVEVPTFAGADYVLRLDTLGGLGPDPEGAPCDPGSLDVRSEVSADFYFVSLPGSVGPRFP